MHRLSSTEQARAHLDEGGYRYNMFGCAAVQILLFSRYCLRSRDGDCSRGGCDQRWALGAGCRAVEWQHRASGQRAARGGTDPVQHTGILQITFWIREVVNIPELVIPVVHRSRGVRGGGAQGVLVVVHADDGGGMRVVQGLLQ
jgi:hypothetical protein